MIEPSLLSYAFFLLGAIVGGVTFYRVGSIIGIAHEKARATIRRADEFKTREPMILRMRGKTQ